MAYRVLYVDDETTENSQAYADGLSGFGLIDISIKTPTSIEALIDELIVEQSNFDSLILDLRLDGNQQGERVARYTAPFLAQGVRSKRLLENGFVKEFPIFLISSKDNLKKFFDSDTSIHDLFDYTFTKADVGGNGNYYESIITSIIDAYQIISTGQTDFNRILNRHNIEEIKNRVFTTKFLTGESTSVSEISQYIFNEIIIKSGILIDENVLAARLGVDFEKSEEWEQLLLILRDYEYTGVFSKAFKRWWFDDILNWWNNNFQNNLLIRLNASERVQLIKEKFNLKNIEEAKPIAKTTSTKFWTVCQAYLKPIDPKDGFLIDGNQLKPWQDKRYISLESILERDAKEKGFAIHPEEKERFDDIKQEYVK
jgi:hypothetical protein